MERAYRSSSASWAQAAGVICGTIVGLISGFFGGWVDTIIMRVIDIMYSFPGIVLAILIISVLGPSLINLIIVLAIYAVPTLSRIVRGNVLSLKEQDYVLAARALGAGRVRIMFLHLLPNTLAPIIVYATLGVAFAILTTASLWVSSVWACSRRRLNGAICSAMAGNICARRRY